MSPMPPASASASPAAPHLREDLLAPRFYTTEIDKAARPHRRPRLSLGAAGQGLRKLGLQLRFGALLLRQFSEPMLPGQQASGAAGAVA